MNITKFKLLKDMPGIKAGKIGYTEEDTFLNGNIDVMFESDCGQPHIFYDKEYVKNNPDWFAPFCFTTEDGIEKYQGESYYCVHTNSGEEGVIDAIAFIEYQMDFKRFSIKEAAKKYLLLEKAKKELTVGNYFIYGNEVHKIDTIKISSLISSEKNYDKALCRKATVEEIISYYEKLGWVKGASFKEKSQTHIRIIELIEYDACTNIVWIIGGQYPNKIEECELIEYPKSWKELRHLKGGILEGFNIQGVYFSKYESLKENMEKAKFSNSKQAESVLAYAQLSQLVAEMNGNKELDWEDTSDKFIITRHNNRLVTDVNIRVFHPLAFKTVEARDFSFEFHKDLWKTYYQL